MAGRSPPLLLRAGRPRLANRKPRGGYLAVVVASAVDNVLLLSNDDRAIGQTSPV
jgi:hypothetical protein